MNDQSSDRDCFSDTELLIQCRSPDSKKYVKCEEKKEQMKCLEIQHQKCIIGDGIEAMTPRTPFATAFRKLKIREEAKMDLTTNKALLSNQTSHHSNLHNLFTIPEMSENEHSTCGCHNDTEQMEFEKILHTNRERAKNRPKSQHAKRRNYSNFNDDIITIQEPKSQASEESFIAPSLASKQNHHVDYSRNVFHEFFNSPDQMEAMEAAIFKVKHFRRFSNDSLLVCHNRMNEENEQRSSYTPSDDLHSIKTHSTISNRKHSSGSCFGNIFKCCSRNKKKRR